MAQTNPFEKHLKTLSGAKRKDPEKQTTIGNTGDRRVTMPKRNKSVIAAALAEPILPLPKCTLNFGNVSSYSLVENTLDWDDFKPGKKPLYNLRHIQTTKAIVELGESVFASLKGTLTNVAVCQLLQLAYNLTDANGTPLFGDIPPELSDGSPMDFKEITSRNLVSSSVCSGPIVHVKADASDQELAIGFCYLAASYLLLFAKSAEKYGRLGAHLKRAFTCFYTFDFPLANYHPDIRVITAIKQQFDTNSQLKNTFYALLYAGESVDTGKDIKSHLYTMHTSYTGMHCYGLFVRCMDLMQVSFDVLAGCFKCNAFRREIDALSVIMSTFHNSGNVTGREKQMWRFARIFDHTFAAHLSTKNSTQFTAILAVMYHKMVPATEKQDARRIAIVKEYIDADDGFVEFYAKTTLATVLKEIKATVTK